MTQEMKKWFVPFLLGATLLTLVGCVHPPYYDPYVSSSYASYPYAQPAHYHGAKGQFVGGGAYGECKEDVVDPCFDCGDSYSNDFECNTCNTPCDSNGKPVSYAPQPQGNPHGQPYCDPAAHMQRPAGQFNNGVVRTAYSNPHTTEGHFWSSHFGGTE